MQRDNLSLLLDLYELTMAQCYLHYRRNTLASFDLFVRELPKSRSYLVFCGLENVLNYLKNLRFRKEDLRFLKSQKLFSADFFDYLAHFKFSGDVWAMPEGEVFFANEPVIRVTAPIIEAQIIETFLLNTVNLETMVASKASRVVYAAGDKKVYDFSLRRTHGQDAGIKAARSSYIAGASGTSNCLAARLYNLPLTGTMAHSFVMSFRQELDSFLAYSSTFAAKTILLVDTYNTKQGIKNAICIAYYLKEKGYRLEAVRLDSGDIVKLSKLARRMLDASGFRLVEIFASGNLDEFKIKALLAKGAKVDSFGVGTNMGVSTDAPSLDVVYKMSEVTDEGGEFLPTMKLSSGKVTYPGRKQVFRFKDKKGRYARDVLGLDKEKIMGKKLLIKVIAKGRLIYKSPSLDKIRISAKNNLIKFPDGLKDIHGRYKYPVILSSRLAKLRRLLAQRIEKGR